MSGAKPPYNGHPNAACPPDDGFSFRRRGVPRLFVGRRVSGPSYLVKLLQQTRIDIDGMAQ
jgi:hypothetical protein